MNAAHCLIEKENHEQKLDYKLFECDEAGYDDAGGRSIVNGGSENVRDYDLC